MKVLFVGSKNIGFKVLKVLFEYQKQGAVEIVGVITRKDDLKSHWYRSVARLAKKLKLPLFLPENINSTDFADIIKKTKPEIGFCCFYTKLFKDPLLNVPKFGFYNLHLSPLPKYRGTIPIQSAIINGEKEHGVTIHKMDLEMDSGDIVSQKLFPIYENDTGYDLYLRCEKHIIPLFHKTLQKFISNNKQLPVKKQDNKQATTYVRSSFKSREVDKNWDIKKKYDFVRAFDIFPPFNLSHMMKDGKKYNLCIYPERHGIDTKGLSIIKYKDKKIYLYPK